MKKVRSFKDLVESMKPSVEELEFREKKSKETDVLSNCLKLFKCTRCSKTFKVNSENNEQVQVHPCLGVLMCTKCYNYYGDGEFSLDSENEDKYCRWCGEGGTLFGCSKCICGFCSTCLRKHFGKKYLKKVEKDDDWLCFFCDPKPLWDERYICSVAMKMFQNKDCSLTSKAENGKKGSENHSNSGTLKKSLKTKELSKSTHNKELNDGGSSSIRLGESSHKNFLKKDRNNSRKRFNSSSSDESEMGLPKKILKRMRFTNQPLKELCEENGNFESLKQIALEKLERILKLSEHQMAFGVNWSSKKLRKLGDPKHITTTEDLRAECQKIKWFLSVLSTYLVEFCNSVESVEKSLTKEDGQKDSSSFSQSAPDSTGFSSVIKFLSFIINQVNMFVKKGLSLSDVLQAEIYDDNKIIGIMKNLKTSSAPSENVINVLPEPSKSNCDENNKETQPNTEAQESKDEKDESPDEDSLQLVVDQSSEVQEGDSENIYVNNSGVVSKDQKKDILHILEILEHA